MGIAAPDVVEKVEEAVAPHAESKGEALEPLNIDFASLARDLEAVQVLFEAIRQAEEDEEDAIIALLAA